MSSFLSKMSSTSSSSTPSSSSYSQWLVSNSSMENFSTAMTRAKTMLRIVSKCTYSKFTTMSTSYYISVITSFKQFKIISEEPISCILTVTALQFSISGGKHKINNNCNFLNLNLRWERRDFHYDNCFVAMLTLFAVQTSEGWVA